MANEITKLLPHRQYDEQDVLNGFAYDGGEVAAGLLVKVTAGNLNNDHVEIGTGGFLNTLGNAYSPFFKVPHKVQLADSGEAAIGILLRDVRELDENGETLRFYPEKKDELQCVTSGEANPIATKGIFTLVEGAFLNVTVPAPMTKLAVRDGGLFAEAASGDTEIATVIATGSRATQGEGTAEDPFTGDYAVIKLEL